VQLTNHDIPPAAGKDAVLQRVL